MSLGFNQFRVPRTNLPGSVGASVVIVDRLPVRRSASSRLTSPRAASARPASARPASASAASASAASARPSSLKLRDAPSPSASAPSASAPLDPSCHWGFATVIGALRNSEGEEVACCGERVCMVYPMETRLDNGNVRMRMKSIHLVTGQLSHEWVDVYDAEQSKHLLGSWSLIS